MPKGAKIIDSIAPIGIESVDVLLPAQRGWMIQSHLLVLKGSPPQADMSMLRDSIAPIGIERHEGRSRQGRALRIQSHLLVLKGNHKKVTVQGYGGFNRTYWY